MQPDTTDYPPCVANWPEFQPFAPLGQKILVYALDRQNPDAAALRRGPAISRHPVRADIVKRLAPRPSSAGSGEKTESSSTDGIR